MIKLTENCHAELSIVPPNLQLNVNDLWNLKPQERDKFKFMGKIIQCPRYSINYLRSYKFGGIHHEAHDLPDLLKPLHNYVNSVTNCNFNQVLVNFYEDGTQYMGPHSDNEKELVNGAPVASISFGATRKFRIRTRDRAIVKDVDLVDGSMLIMKDDFQNEFLHEIVKINGEKGKAVGKRVNITFRLFS